MTAPILSRFGFIYDDPEALEAVAEGARTFLGRPLRSHRQREGQLWERLTELSMRSELAVIRPLPVSPDCRDGNKHRACTGEAWDFTTDAETVCTCPCHQTGEAA